MLKENSGTIWYGVYIAIIFFSIRLLLETWNYPVGNPLLRNAYAGAAGFVGGLLIGYLLRSQTELSRFLVALALVAIGVVAYVSLA